MDGIINLNKPGGITSSAAVGKVRRIFGIKKVGHMGTLDPQGTGVLLIGVGRGARLFDYFLDKDKEYYAVFRFGIETDTLDGEGKITRTSMVIPTAAQIEAALPELSGKVAQMPPLYSAKNIGGKRAYDLARRGETFELKPKTIDISSLKLTEKCDEASFGFLVTCSGGTYVRSIARDLAAMLGTCAIMTAIERRRAGRFCIDSAVSLDALDKSAIIPVADAIDLPSVTLPDEFYIPLCNGVKPLFCVPQGRYKLFCNGEFFGIGASDGRIINLSVNLRSI